MFGQHMLLAAAASGGGLPAENATDLIGTMSGYTLGSITVSAQSEFGGATSAWEAFDKSTGAGNRWVATLGASQWLKVDFGSAQVVYSYMLQGRNGTEDPGAWTFEGSNDDSAWTTLDTRSSIGSSSAEQDFSLASGVEYRYYRWLFTASNGGSEITIVEAQIRD
jgi:hypothetical protein